MATPINTDDSDDLQTLFDSIAAGGGAQPEPAPAAQADASGDSDDLEALFDSVSAQAGASVSAAPAAAAESAAPVAEDAEEAVFNHLGHMARNLHDTLRELGHDSKLENAAKKIPDARDRLNYIAQMTEQAASRVLNATDIAKPLQDDLLARSGSMAQRWEKMFANQLSVDEFKALAVDTRAYFTEAPAKLKTINEQTMEIVMAQDFQDLTGQVVKKVIDLAQQLETQLVQVLIEAMPEEKKAEAPEGLMNGPVINAAGRSDVVTSQEQVDDLLESLGF